MNATKVNSGGASLPRYKWLIPGLVLLAIAAVLVILVAGTDKVIIYKVVGIVLTLSIVAFFITVVMIGYSPIRSTEMVQESDRQYRQLIEQATDGIFIANKDDLFILVNSKMCEMLGYTEDELHHLRKCQRTPCSYPVRRAHQI
jgi:PAS domain-containing protein